MKEKGREQSVERILPSRKKTERKRALHLQVRFYGCMLVVIIWPGRTTFVHCWWWDTISFKKRDLCCLFCIVVVAVLFFETLFVPALVKNVSKVWENVSKSWCFFGFTMSAIDKCAACLSVRPSTPRTKLNVYFYLNAKTKRVVWLEAIVRRKKIGRCYWRNFLMIWFQLEKKTRKKGEDCY